MSRSTTNVLAWSRERDVYELHQVAGAPSSLEGEGAAWFSWLDHASSFTFRGKAGSYAARKECRGRNEGYWYAYTRIAGKVMKRYLGKSSVLTVSRLEEVATQFQALAVQRKPAFPDSNKAKKTSDSTPSSVQEDHAPPPARVQEQRVYLLLATKMHIPEIPTGLLPRPRLSEQLHQALTHRLTVITAPAGFGKTTAVSAWLRASPVVAAWLSLDEGDNDLVRFWTYVFSSLQTGYREICTSLLEQLRAPSLHQSPHIEHLLTRLVNALDAGSQQTILMLDDYHAVTSPAIHASLVFLLEHLPSTLHIMLLTRVSPPLHLARLRACNQLLELRATDLRFTLDEASSFLKTVMRLQLSPEEIALLAERTEGWPAALQLAGLSLRQPEANRQNTFALGQRYIFDYLAEEVLQGQPEYVQEFLLHTALLTRLSGSLCDALTGNSDGAGLLAYLERANLFVVALDEAHCWYRYHQLFAEFLKARLREQAPELAAVLHAKAADWYEQHGYLAEAIYHLNEMKAYTRLGRCVVAWSDRLIGRGDFTLLRQWVELLPRQEVRASPRLCLVYARTLAFLGQLDTATLYLQELEAVCAGTDDGEQTDLRGEILASHALIAIMRLETAQAITLAQQALACLPPQHGFIRSVLTLSLGIAYRSYNAEAAREALGEAIRQADNPHVAIMSTYHLAYHLQLQGQFHRAFELYQHALAFLPGDQRIPALAVALLGCAEIYREWNRLEEAERWLMEAIPLGKAWSFLGILTGIIVTLARVKQARGDFAAVRLLLRQHIRAAEEQQDAISLSTARAYLANLDLAEGNRAAALAWAEEFAESVRGMEPEVFREREYLLLAHIQIQTGEGKLHEISALLDKLLALFEPDDQRFAVLKILILQSLLYQRQHDTERALATLMRALTLSEPEGFIRIFADEGQPLLALLERAIERRQRTGPLSAQRFSLAYARLVLQATAQASMARQGPLSEREGEIVRLVAAGLSNQQIAQHLTIALSTVKWHIKQIYNKLNVNSRTQLLAYAREQKWL